MQVKINKRLEYSFLSQGGKCSGFTCLGDAESGKYDLYQSIKNILLYLSKGELKGDL